MDRVHCVCCDFLASSASRGLRSLYQLVLLRLLDRTCRPHIPPFLALHRAAQRLRVWPHRDNCENKSTRCVEVVAVCVQLPSSFVRTLYCFLFDLLTTSLLYFTSGCHTRMLETLIATFPKLSILFDVIDNAGLSSFFLIFVHTLSVQNSLFSSDCTISTFKFCQIL